MQYLKKYLQKTTEENQDLSAISFLSAVDHIYKTSPLVAEKIIQELIDQRSYLKLIASENYSSLAVQQTMGNLLTDKYSEGIAGKRFYAGCENVDAIEEEAVTLVKKIFGCDHAYIQPHSGADANLVAFWAILTHKIQSKELEKLGKKKLDELTDAEYEKIRQLLVNQKIMGMSLNAGGHLTHGYRLNISSKFMKASSYDVDHNTGMLDYDVLSKQVKEEKPLILIAGYSAYPRLINFAKMKEIADSVKAVLMVDMAHFAGLLAGKAIKGEYDPVPYADVITSTTHKTLRGPRGGIILCKEEYKEVVDKGCPLVLGGPLPHVMAAKLVAFKEVDTQGFQDYAKQIIKNAQALANELIKENVCVLTKGTDNHLVMIDVNKSFSLTGKQAENILRKAHLTVNRNSIYDDVNGPWYTSGVRLGTSALTTLGMKEDDMKQIAQILVNVLKNAKPVFVEKTNSFSKALANIDEKILSNAQNEVKDLLKRYPLYPQIVI